MREARKAMGWLWVLLALVDWAGWVPPALAAVVGLGGDEEKAVDLIRIENTEGLPAELAEADALWESVLGPVPGRGVVADVTVRRLYPDGTLWTFGNRRRTADARGLPRPVPAPSRWRLSARVGDVGPIEAAIREHFLKLPAKVGERASPEARAMGWRAALGDGTRHTVVSVDARDTPEIRAVELAVARGITPGAVPVEQPE